MSSKMGNLLEVSPQTVRFSSFDQTLQLNTFHTALIDHVAVSFDIAAIPMMFALYQSIHEFPLISSRIVPILRMFPAAKYSIEREGQKEREKRNDKISFHALAHIGKIVSTYSFH